MMYAHEHTNYVSTFDNVIEKIMYDFFNTYSFIIQIFHYIFKILSSILEKQTFAYTKRNQNVPNTYSYLNLNHVTEIVNNLKYGTFTLIKELKDISEIANTSEFDKQFMFSLIDIEKKYKILPLLKNIIIPLIMNIFNMLIELPKLLRGVGGKRRLTKKRACTSRPSTHLKYSKKRKPTHQQKYITRKTLNQQ